MIRALRTSGPLMLPSASVFLLIFVAPLSYFFILSFWRVKSYKLVADVSLANYIRVFDQYTDALLFTFGIALIISVVVTALAFGFAFVVRFKAGRFSTVLLFGVLITLFGGYLSKIYIWKIILGQSGILNSALLGLGFIDTPLGAFLYNPAAVVITLTHYLLPLAILRSTTCRCAAPAISAPAAGGCSGTSSCPSARLESWLALPWPSCSQPAITSRPSWSADPIPR